MKKLSDSERRLVEGLCGILSTELLRNIMTLTETCQELNENISELGHKPSLRKIQSILKHINSTYQSYLKMYPELPSPALRDEWLKTLSVEVSALLVPTAVQTKRSKKSSKSIKQSEAEKRQLKLALS